MKMSKQYMMMVTEEIMPVFMAMFRGNVQFLEIEGMTISDNSAYNLIATPVAKQGASEEGISA
jgi:hypothetical protein